MRLCFGLRNLWWMGLTGLILIGAVFLGKTVVAKSSVIPAETAVQLALSYAYSNIYVEWLAPPSGIYGKVMTYGEAVPYGSDHLMHSNDEDTKRNDVAVWLILLQGDIVEHVPAAPAGSPEYPAGIPENHIQHNQWVVIIDAVSGEKLEAGWGSPLASELQNSMPVLTPPTLGFPLPTNDPIHTAIPLPTLGPAPSRPNAK